MQFSFIILAAVSFSFSTAQQYAGDIISAYLPTISRAEVAFFKIPDPDELNNNLTLINYYSHGSNGARLVESNIKRAVIVIHGLLRDPWNYANDVRKLAPTSEKHFGSHISKQTLNALEKVTDSNIDMDSVAVMAPYFPNGADKGYAYPWTEGLASGKGSTSNALVWAGSQWSAGSDNEYPHNSRNTSSFYVLDTLIRYFDDKTLFPNLNEIVLVGHSMGGQMLQRYAAIGDQLDTISPVTLWVGNPDSMVWLSEDRPLTTEDCSTYDEYRAGYSNFTDYPRMTYGAGLVDQGRDAIWNNMMGKRIAWARGTLDFGNQARTCAEYTQGADRNERFFYFIKQFTPSCSDPNGPNCETVDLIPVTHDNGQMFGSAAGLARLFTDNFYGTGNRSYDFGYPRQQAGDDPYPNPAYAGTSGVTNTNTYAGDMTYQGCWTNQEPITPAALPTLLYDNATNTLESCTSGCVDSGYTIAGVQNSTQCYCGNAMRSESAVLTVDSSCRLTCSGNAAEICGGANRLSIFSSAYPTFIS